jgi:hypothetical protein
MTTLPAKISTNVRFLALLAAAAFDAGCAAAPRSSARPCPVAELLVCAPFGPERACRCERQAEIGVLRDPLAGPAWRDGITR